MHSKSNQLKVRDLVLLSSFEAFSWCLQLLGVEYSAVRWHYIGHVQRNKMKLLVGK